MWDELLEEEGFAAKWGPRTAERRHLAYNFSCDHPCTWNGPSWPFETSRLLTALAEFLNTFPSTGKMSASIWLSLLSQYARVHTRSMAAEPSTPGGFPVPAHPWIGEDIHPDEGYWIAREYMLRHQEADWRRGFMYNHATFCDLVITGLAGLRPRDDDTLEINPLVDSRMHFFALRGVKYHGHIVSIVWDADGLRYGQGQGLQVWVDGVLSARSATLQKLNCMLPAVNRTQVTSLNKTRTT